MFVGLFARPITQHGLVIGARSRQQNASIFGERQQRAVVLEQYDRAPARFQRQRAMRRMADHGPRVLLIGQRPLEQAQPKLQGQDALHGRVDARQWELPRFDQ